ncbi:MAG: fumarate hydratase, partial [Archangium gephyra]
MAITYELVKEVTANLYDWSLRRIPESSKAEFRKALASETEPQAR